MHLIVEVAAIRLALPVNRVREVVHAAELTPLPGAPPLVAGLVDVAGELHPVLDLRARLGFESRAVSARDHFVLARAGGVPIALHVEGVEGVAELDVAEEESVRGWTGDPAIEGVARTAEGLVLIHDLDRFLSIGEWTELDRARREIPAGSG